MEQKLHIAHEILRLDTSSHTINNFVSNRESVKDLSASQSLQEPKLSPKDPICVYMYELCVIEAQRIN